MANDREFSLSFRLAASLASSFASTFGTAERAIGNLISIAGKVAAFSVVTDGLKSAYDEAVKFESAMADVRKVVDFDTPQQFKEMSNDIINLTKTLPMTAEDLAKIVAAGGQAGIAKDDLLDFADAAAKMGVAFDVTAEEAGDMMAKWRTAFKMNQNQVVELADKINYLGNTTAASAPLISDVVTRVGPLGGVAGVASGEIAALGASMIGVGTPSEVAATGIQNFLLALTAGNSMSDKAYMAMERLGFAAEDVAARMQVDAKGAILDVLEAIRQLPKEEQAATLSTIFGKESIKAIAPLLDNMENLQANLNKVADASQYAGSMQGEFDARCQTTENSVQLLENKITAVGISIGTAMLPAVNQGVGALSGFIDKITETVGKMQDWADANPQLATALEIFFGILTVGFIAAAAGSAIYTTAMTAAAMVTSTFASVVAVLTSPIFLVIAAIAALSAAAYLLYKNWDKVKEFMANLWEAIKAKWNAAMEYISAAVSGFVASVKAFFASLPDRIAYAVGYIIGCISTLPGKIQAFITQAAAFISELPGALMQMGISFIAAAGVWLSNTWSTIVTWFTQIVSGAGEFLNQLPQKCMEAGENFVANARSWASEAFYAVKEWISKIPSMVSDYISNAWANAKAKFSAGFSAGSGDEPPGHAKGGIFDKPHLAWFAEDGPEAAIPLDGSQNAMNLWQRAGEALGAFPSGGAAVGASATPSTNNFTMPAININLNFSGPVDRQSVIDAAGEAGRNFAEEYNRYMHERRRTSYA